ncbi:hypothetical protein ACKZDW_22265 [Ralstonia syzygii subsp. celebesensis]|uniref:hypothetical protein n=1 Tax=Ralstonia syzygii TaxID=28097 RepID=UPI00387E1A6D
MDDRYRGVFGQRRVVFANAEDLRAIGMKDGDRVDLLTVSEDGVARRADGFRLVPYDIPVAAWRRTTPRPTRWCRCPPWPTRPARRHPSRSR